MMPCIMLLSTAIILIVSAGVSAAQEFAQAPTPQLRRGPDGQIELVVPTPQQRSATPLAPAAPGQKPPALPKSGLPAANPVPLTTSQQQPAEISLPEPFAIEMPNGSTELTPAEAPLHNLLAGAASGNLQVTNDQTLPVRVGAVRITFTAWQGEPWKSSPAGIKTAILHVFPAGFTPVGISGDENSTTNNSAKIARDANGRVHMVWLDGGRPGTVPRVLYRRAAISPDNRVVWETDPARVSNAPADLWNAYPSLAVSANTVHFAWQSNRTALYRQLSLRDGTWEWGPIQDTTALSEGRDVGPSIASSSTGVIHIATPTGFDAVSRDGGTTWKAEPIPLPPGQKAKTTSVAIDQLDNAHFAISAVVRGPENESVERASRGYWELRYTRRSAELSWSPSENALAGVPEWGEPTGDDDVLADWVRILADGANNLHLTWHGTAETRIYGNDHAYYMRRPAGASPWQRPISLVSHAQAKSRPFSFAPSLALDGGTAIAVTFYDVYDGGHFVGFDALARIVGRGIVDEHPIALTEFVRKSIDQKEPEIALSARFPAAAPQLYHDQQGRIWLDLLETLIPFEANPRLIVYQRVDVTTALARK